MSPVTRQEKLKAFGELSKLPEIQKASVFADERNKAKLLISHPHDYRDWEIVGPADVRGFYRLESSVRVGLDYYEERMVYIHDAFTTNDNYILLQIVEMLYALNEVFDIKGMFRHKDDIRTSVGRSECDIAGMPTSRDYLDPNKKEELDLIAHRLQRLGIEGLICVGGDGTLNGLQPLAERLPTVLAPKPIDNDLGLNYPDEPDKWVRVPEPNTKGGYRYEQRESHAVFDLEYIVKYVTPGYAKAVYVSASGVERIRQQPRAIVESQSSR